ncbi:MAG: hypothetical protein ACOZAJ_03000 [Patescibacteria group bacterium]
MVNGLSGIGAKISYYDRFLQKVFDKTPAVRTAANTTLKTRAFDVFQKSGHKLNAVTYNVANKAGWKLLDVITKPNSGFIGNLVSKIPGIGKLAEGLTKVGKAGSKIPGLGTLIAVGTGLWGIGKAACRALKGDFKGAGHQLLKSAGSVAGMMAGLALMATGVGFLPGLALAVGTGIAGDWIGKKAADTLFPSVAAREEAEANSAAYTSAGNATAYAGGSPSFTGGQYPEDAIIKSIMSNPRYY